MDSAPLADGGDGSAANIFLVHIKALNGAAAPEGTASADKRQVQ
jgi:hypothetical protein